MQVAGLSGVQDPQGVDRGLNWASTSGSEVTQALRSKGQVGEPAKHWPIWCGTRSIALRSSSAVVHRG